MNDEAETGPVAADAGESAADNSGKEEQKRSSAGKNWIIYPFLLAAPFAIIQLLVISSFMQLPGPIYGGDIYWHYGETLGIAYGNSPLENPQMQGEFAYYPWLTQLLIASLSGIFGSFFSAYIYFAVIQTFLASLAFFFMGRVFFSRNNYAAALVVLLSLPLLFQPSIGGTGGFVFFPLFLAFFYRSFSPGIRNKVLAGLCFGLASLSHVTYFPVMVLLVFLSFLYLAFFRDWRINFGENRLSLATSPIRFSGITSALGTLLPTFAIGLAISMLFWGPVIFVYGAKTLNPTDVYANVDLNRFGLDVVYESVSGTFFSIGALLNLDVRGFVFSLVVLAGLYLAWKHRSRPREKLFLAVVLAAIILGVHHLVSLPLFGRAAIPPRLYGAAISPLVPMLFALAVGFAYSYIKDKNVRKILGAFIVIFVMLPAAVFVSSGISSDRWLNAGKNPDYAFAEVEDWIVENTELNAIFLSHQELAFAVNGISARKVMISRRTHTSPYINMDQRLADAAVILYGSNDSKRAELLRKYGVKYVYWDANWLAFSANEPVLVFPEYDSYLEENGVAFQRVNSFLDPAAGPRHPRYNLLAVGPARNDIQMPWAEGLDKHLQLEKEFFIQGQLFARIYRVSSDG